ncbi:MAG: NAD(P)-dependent oxidoreductase [bacterium]
MKILITGGSGLLGQYLNITLSKANQILTLYNSNEGNCRQYKSLKVDLTDREKLNDLFLSFSPDIVIHTAAISRPELCDELPEEFIIAINVTSAKSLAELCEKYKAQLIFTSTDLVYDGDSGQMQKEDSKVNPISLYAKTKVIAEKEIKATFDNFIILRTSLLYGIGLNDSVNNFHNMFFSLKKNRQVKLFHNQFRTPLALSDAANLMSELIKLNVRNITLNFGGNQRISRAELGVILCDRAGFDRELIIETSMFDIAALHKVKDVSMDTSRLQSLGLKQKSIIESIDEIVEQYC